MQYSKEVLDKIRSGDTSLLRGLSPLATVALGLQLQQEAKDKVNETEVNINKVGEIIHGLNNDKQSVKHVSTTYFKTKEEVTSQ